MLVVKNEKPNWIVAHKGLNVYRKFIPGVYKGSSCGSRKTHIETFMAWCYIKIGEAN